MLQQHAHCARTTTLKLIIYSLMVRAGYVCVAIIHRSLNMDHRIFIVRTDVITRDCTRRCTDTEMESALKVDSGNKIPCRTGGSSLRQRRDGPML